MSTIDSQAGRRPALAASDDARLADLFVTQRVRLERLASAVLGGDGSGAEDVVADVFVRFVELVAAGRLPGGDVDEAAYLAQMVRNRCLDLHRARSRWRPAPAEAHEAWLGGELSAEERALEREQIRDVLADVAALPARQREVLLANRVHGEPHTSIAARADGSVDTSKSLMLRARRNLRALRDARDACCDVVRLDLDLARERGVRPAEDVRRHLRVCAPCRLHDARRRGAAAKVRIGAVVGGWLQPLLELAHTPAVAPMSRSLAVGLAAIAPVFTVASTEAAGTASERPDRPVAAATTMDRAPGAGPASSPSSVGRPRVAAPRRPATRTTSRARRAAALRARVPYDQLYDDVTAGGTLTKAERERVAQVCAAFGQKGMVGPKAVTDLCPPGTLDTPQRRKRLARVQAARAAAAERRRRARAAADAAADAASAPATEETAAPVDPAPDPPEATTLAPPPGAGGAEATSAQEAPPAPVADPAPPVAPTETPTTSAPATATVPAAEIPAAAATPG